MISLLLATAAMFAAEPGMPNYTLASCDDPAMRAKILETDPEKLASLDAMKSRSAAKEAEMDALMTKLATRAHLSAEQRAEVAMKSFQSPEFQAEFEKGMALVGTMLGHVEAIARSKEEVPNCRAIVQMMESLPAIEANADRQWAIMRKIVDDEAARRGVTLTD
jgi:hypothetical protein